MPFKFFFTALMVLPIVLTVSCSDNRDEATESQKKLILGTSADMPPFEYYKSMGSETKIVGFDIEVAELIAAKLGKELVIKDMDFSGLIPALKSGRIEMAMASITPTADRLKVIDFSESYLNLPVAVLLRDDVDFQSENDFAGRKVGTQLGSSHEQVAKNLLEKHKDMKLISINKLGEIVQELKSSRIDAAIMETKTARSFQKNHPELRVKVLDGQNVSFAIALPKGSELREPINNAIAELQQSGKIAELQKKWF